METVLKKKEVVCVWITARKLFHPPLPSRNYPSADTFHSQSDDTCILLFSILC